MYESPITLINGAFHLNLEDGVYKAVRQTGIVVDKDEMIKALKYDRGQYEKGYADAKTEQKLGEWVVTIGDLYPGEKCGTCSQCGYKTGFYLFFDYCPKCGAKMEGTEDGGFNQ